jgi:hypothetical protein
MKARFSIVAIMVSVLMMIFATACFAQPVGPAAARLPQADFALRVHGFHCKPEFGWDGRVGQFRWHRHVGICQDWRRCFEIYKFCEKAFGEGFRQYRADKCMLRNGCY